MTCSLAVVDFNLVENITVNFPSSEDDHDYTTEQIKLIETIQQKYKARNRLMDFDYFLEGTKFNFQIFWLKTKSLLLFKIFLYGEGAQSGREIKNKRINKVAYINPNDQTLMGSFIDRIDMPDTLSRFMSKQSSMRIIEERSSITDLERNRIGGKILYQNLKISVEEVLADGDSETSRQKVKK